jgi:hypothetical protein
MAKPSLLGEPTRLIRKRVSSGKFNQVPLLAKKQYGSDGYHLWGGKTDILLVFNGVFYVQR